MFYFFFSSRRRHTRWNCDWSSDVCSSDLEVIAERVDVLLGGGQLGKGDELGVEHLLPEAAGVRYRVRLVHQGHPAAALAAQVPQAVADEPLDRRPRVDARVQGRAGYGAAHPAYRPPVFSRYRSTVAPGRKSGR